MYSQRTKDKVKQHIIKKQTITANQLQYLDKPVKQINNVIMKKLIEDLETEDFIILDKHQIGERTYRVVKYKNQPMVE